MPKKKTQTPIELAIEIVERESVKYFLQAQDESLYVAERKEAMENATNLDKAAEFLKAVKEI